MSSTLMKIAGYSSGMTPRDGYRDWFVIEQILLPSFPSVRHSARSSKQMSDNKFEVGRRLDALTHKLLDMLAKSERVRYILVDIDGGRQPMAHLRFDGVMVAAHRFPEDPSQLEWVSFTADSWAMT